MAKYIIKSESNGIVSIVSESTRKRDIESRFNRLMRTFNADSKFLVENIRIGYSKVTFFGSFGCSETEYWIARV